MLVAAIAAAALASIYVFTKPRIEAQKQLEITQALEQVLPKATHFVKITDELYLGEKGKELVGKVYMVAPVGYSGPISILVGVSKQLVVTGVKIIALTETPGLGLSATNPTFLKQFIGKIKEDKLQAKEDIDALTGATITTQAVCDGVKEALDKSQN